MASELAAYEHDVREGKFQCGLLLLTAARSVASGLEVAYEHYRGSYSRRVMYTPCHFKWVARVSCVCGLLQPESCADGSAFCIGSNTD